MVGPDPVRHDGGRPFGSSIRTWTPLVSQAQGEGATLGQHSFANVWAAGTRYRTPDLLLLPTGGVGGTAGRPPPGDHHRGGDFDLIRGPRRTLLAGTVGVGAPPDQQDPGGEWRTGAGHSGGGAAERQRQLHPPEVQAGGAGASGTCSATRSPSRRWASEGYISWWDRRGWQGLIEAPRCHWPMPLEDQELPGHPGLQCGWGGSLEVAPPLGIFSRAVSAGECVTVRGASLAPCCNGNRGTGTGQTGVLNEREGRGAEFASPPALSSVCPHPSPSDRRRKPPPHRSARPLPEDGVLPHHLSGRGGGGPALAEGSGG